MIGWCGPSWPASVRRIVRKATEIIGEDSPAVWFFMWQAYMAVSDNVDGLSLPASSADMDNRAIFRENWKVTSKRQ